MVVGCEMCVMLGLCFVFVGERRVNGDLLFLIFLIFLRKWDSKVLGVSGSVFPRMDVSPPLDSLLLFMD